MRQAPALLVLATAALLPGPAGGEVRETLCEPFQVLVTEDRIEVTCVEPIEIGDTERDRRQPIVRFAYPMLSQSFEPLLGSQVHLVDYHLSQMQAALASGNRLRIWFETDTGRSHLYGCEPSSCRPIVALGLERTLTP